MSYVLFSISPLFIPGPYQHGWGILRWQERCSSLGGANTPRRCVIINIYECSIKQSYFFFFCHINCHCHHFFTSDPLIYFVCCVSHRSAQSKILISDWRFRSMWGATLTCEVNILVINLIILDGVAPLISGPPPTSFNNLSGTKI